jgi:hypothetical protein
MPEILAFQIEVNRCRRRNAGDEIAFARMEVRAQI